MPEYNKFELQALIDLLAKHTSIYTGYMSRGVFSGEQFSRCKRTLAEIHDAIKAKKIDQEKQTEIFFQEFTNKKDLFQAGSQEPSA